MSADDRDIAESDRLDAYPHPRETAVLVGQGSAEADLLDAFRAGRLPHAWLLGGPEGVGKATLAWRFARFVLAYPDPAVPEVRDASDLALAPDHPMAKRIASGGSGDVAVLRREWNDKTGRLFSEIRVEDVRRATGLFQRSSRTGGYRICIIDCVEDLNRAGANALLKLIEEPPPLSLFLLIAHRPARILPTLRSRCRLLVLPPLSSDDVLQALRVAAPSSTEAEPEALAEAAARSGGSVRHALHSLGGERLALDRETRALLDRLPSVDWGGLHRLADRIGSDQEAFDLLLEAILDWIHGRLQHLAATDAAPRLAPLAEVWEKIRRSAQDAESLNLDKRATLLSIFADLARATRAP
ncbi:MAG TPA: DNA polymerase III subunit delta' [Lichenihabitans sp.]|jgi:DNA polymerase-3 subunit delta'|nr:DNA polymerase III subunit delta' [Lichenihabitans sp.]